MEAADKVRENRVRRWARRLGYTLYRSRARKLHINDRGLYRLTDDRNRVIEGIGFDATIEKIETVLSEVEKRLA
jgi:hypothetical protein